MGTQLTLANISENNTLQGALDWLLRHGLPEARPATFAFHSDNARWLAEFFGAETPLGAITYEAICRYRDKEGPRGRGIRYTTVKKRLVTLHMALKQAMFRGLLEKLPHFPEVPNDAWAVNRYIQKEDLKKLVDAAPERWRLFLVVAFWTGMRMHDLRETRWLHIDLKKRMFLRRSSKNNARPEWFPMSDELYEALFVEYETKRPHPSHLVLGPCHNVVRYMGKICEEAGVDRVSPHDLRRSLKRHLDAIGANPTFVHQLLCHSQAVAARHYEGVTPELLEAGRRVLSTS